MIQRINSNPNLYNSSSINNQRSTNNACKFENSSKFVNPSFCGVSTPNLAKAVVNQPNTTLSAQDNQKYVELV